MRKSALAFVIAATAIAAIASSPADAKPRHRAVAPPPRSSQQQLPGSAISPGSDPTGGYRNGRLIGRDPDPAIRLQIEQYYGRGAAS